MFMAYGQRENQLPIKSASAATDTIRIVKDNQSALMLRSVLQGAIYDTLDAHTDTLQALRADIDAGGSSLLLDSINVHRVEIDNLHDSIAAHNTEIDANLDSIAVHRIEIDANLDSIADHRTEINANTSTGSTNGTNISSNSVFISVNTAKTTNATHTGDVEGSGALTIAVDAVDIPMLSASGTASSSTYLRGDNSWGTPAGGGSSDSAWTSVTVDTVLAKSSTTDTSYIVMSTSTIDAIELVTKNGETESAMGVQKDAIGLISKSTNGTTFLSIEPAEFTLSHADTYPITTYSRITIDDNKMEVRDGINEKGLEYAADYSANFTDRSLVDKEYVDKPAVILHSLTDGAPTDAQIDSATGTTPATAGEGRQYIIEDSDGSGLIYIIISDGTNWQYTAMTKAL